VTVDQDRAAAPGQDIFDEIEREAGESVFVGNHNLCDIAAERSVQKGFKTFALPVDPGGDIGDKAVVGVFSAKVGDLSVEVSALLFGGDPTVDDLILFLLVPVLGNVEEDAVVSEPFVDVSEVEQALLGAAFDETNVAFLGHFNDLGVGDFELPSDGSEGDEFRLRFFSAVDDAVGRSIGHLVPAVDEE
jgi:hypothetical protein